MTRTLESKACSTCASAKRKCDRRTPECSRCRRSRRRCFYPLTRPGSFVWVELDGSQSDTANTVSTDSAGIATPHSYSQPEPLSYREFPDPAALPDDVAASLRPPLWFTGPETWEIYHYVPAEQNNFPDDKVKQYLAYIRGWLTDWVQTGSNQFIHPRLYQARFPRPMQRAFTALSSYENRTAETEATVLRIVEDGAAELVQETDALLRTPTAEGDALEHLARAQALLTYQYIGLFDGNIKLRHQAERRMAVLTGLMERLVDRARSTHCLGSLLVWPNPDRPFTGIALTDVSDYEDLLWYSWILAECIRRTWLVVSGVQAMYDLLKEGRTDCMGGMMCTTRKGVFEARSAIVWERLCSRVNVGMIKMEQGEKLMQDAAPDELDDFAKVVLEITYGTERIERWKADRQGTMLSVPHSCA